MCADSTQGVGDDAARSVIPCASLRPPDFESAEPNSARMVDHLLGGSANFDADRQAVARVLAADPLSARRVRTNRAFAVRALRWAVARGHDQFLDLGCGIPSVGSTHTTVRALDPTTRVAYVDVDPVATTHAAALVHDVPRVSVTRADLGHPGAVLAHPGVTGVLDLARPVVVLASGSPHWVPGDLAEIVAGYRDALAPGSVLVLSQRTRESIAPSHGDGFDAVMRRAIAPMVLRTRDEIVAVFDGFDLVAPGVVDVAHWPAARPGQEPMSYWCGVGVRA